MLSDNVLSKTTEMIKVHKTIQNHFSNCQMLRALFDKYVSLSVSTSVYKFNLTTLLQLQHKNGYSG
jgi:hypothetical protein